MSAPIERELEYAGDQWVTLSTAGERIAALEAQLNHESYLHDKHKEEWARERAALEAQVQTLKAQLAAYNTPGFADADAMASAYLDMRVRAENAEAQNEQLREACREAALVARAALAATEGKA